MLGWGPFFSRALHKWVILSRLKVLHCGHYNSKLPLVKLICLFTLVTKFYSLKSSHWNLLAWVRPRPTLDPVHPRPSLNLAGFWIQSGIINAQIKSESSWCKICGARFWEGLTHEWPPEVRMQGASSELKGPNRYLCLAACCSCGPSVTSSVSFSDTRTVKR